MNSSHMQLHIAQIFCTYLRKMYLSLAHQYINYISSLFSLYEVCVLKCTMNCLLEGKECRGYTFPGSLTFNPSVMDVDISIGNSKGGHGHPLLKIMFSEILGKGCSIVGFSIFLVFSINSKPFSSLKIAKIL